MDEMITGELLESTYYFCLKHVSDPSDAEDLTSEILCEALAARDKKVDNFYAWFWKMAKNRVNMFYRLKKNGALLLEEFVDVPANEPELDSELIKSEEISELNYHISRLSSLHRNVVIMHYLKNMSVGEIAAELGVPEGTVKRRLFDARQDIKKGMETMTNYGRSAYAPVDVNLWGGYNIPDHWGNISDLMTKQIFACCAFEAKTIKEIADEIGCAPVYFEAKIQYLVENKFLKETANGRYIDDFCALPAQVWADNRYEISLIYKDLGKEMTELIKENEDELRKFDFYGNDMPFGELLWFFYYIFSDGLQEAMKEKNEKLFEQKVPKGNGKNYRFSASLIRPDEKIEYRDPGVKSIGWSNLHSTFMTSGYKWVMYGNIFEAEPFGERDDILGDKNIDLFMRIFDDPKLEMTETEKYSSAELIKRGYLKERDGGLYPTMPIMHDKVRRGLIEFAKKCCDALAEKYVEKIAKVSERILLPAIRKDLFEEYANWLLPSNFWTMSYLYGYGMDEASAGLTKPEDYNNTALATYIAYC